MLQTAPAIPGRGSQEHLDALVYGKPTTPYGVLVTWPMVDTEQSNYKLANIG